MISDPLSVDKAIERLNSMVAADRDALRALVAYRVSCNQALVHHPSVQIQVQDDHTNLVGLLGILNGIFGSGDNGGPLEAVFDDGGTLIGFRRRCG